MTDMSKRVAALPVDDRSGLPVPWVTATLANGRPDFSVIDVGKLRELIERRICGVCGTKLGAYLAFIGGPSAAAQGCFVDPPMHRECAEDSLRWCPHIARQLPVHRSQGRVRPDAYYLYVCRDFKLVPFTTSRQENTLGFMCDPPRELHRYNYVDGQLTYERPVSQDDPALQNPVPVKIG